MRRAQKGINYDPNGSVDSATVVTILKTCAKNKDLQTGASVHADILKRGFLENLFVASTLVSMYAKCGALVKAKEVFEDLQVRDVVSWNALMSGYVQGQYDREALTCFEQMQCEGLLPDAFTFACTLKGCGNTGVLVKGENAHFEIVQRGLLDGNVVLGGALVDMYAKCGALLRAKEVLEGLSACDVVSWNALIAGYVENDYGEEALDCFGKLQRKGLHPNAVTFILLLKACGSIGALEFGEKIHSEVLRQDLLSQNALIGGALVDMYARCGAFAKAQKALEMHPSRTVALWNALITGYVHGEHAEEALNSFKQMHREGFSADVITFVCVLKACGSIRALGEGEHIHSEIVRQDLLAGNAVLGGALMDMYVKCSKLVKAQEVLEELTVQSVILWNMLIAGYVQEEQVDEAWDCFERMQCGGHSPDAVTFSCILKVCGSIGALDKGENIHSQIVRHGLLCKNIVLGGALVDMYVKCGALAKAKEVLDGLEVRDEVSWSALIAGFVQGEHYEEALSCFEQMQCEGLAPDAVTFACILKACGSTGALNEGKNIHCKADSQGLLDGNVILGGALVDMYAGCCAFEKAQEMLENLPVRDVVSWNALIAGYMQDENSSEAVSCYKRMLHEGMSPDAVTFICILNACGSLVALDSGEDIHCEILQQNLLDRDSVIAAALVDMYARCGALAKAKELFESLPIRDVVLWNTLLAGYVLGEEENEALNCFDRMQREGFSSDAITYACILKACSSIGALDKGESVRLEIVRQGLLDGNVVLGGALVDMYAKCGAIGHAKEVLEGLPVRNVILWNALIAGYAQGQHVEEALSCFERMQQEGLSPDDVTFLCVLNACTHSYQLATGQIYFDKMRSDYSIMPKSEHHTCIVSLLGRLGLLEKAAAVVERMHPSVDLPVWVVMLRACLKSGNIKLGRWAFEHAAEFASKEAAV